MYALIFYSFNKMNLNNSAISVLSENIFFRKWPRCSDWLTFWRILCDDLGARDLVSLALHQVLVLLGLCEI